MNKQVLINMLLQLKDDKPNDMEFGGLVRKLLVEYEVGNDDKTYPYL